MAEDAGAAGSLADIAAFGHKLSISLQTLVESSYGNSNLVGTIFHVSSTASSLVQIQETLDKDRDAAFPIFQEAGRREIHRLAAQCKRTYQVIILGLNKAAESLSTETKLELPTEGLKDVPISIAKLEARDGLDSSWLRPRRRHWERELQRIKFDLFLLLLLATIAQRQLLHSTRTPGSFEEEQALRGLAERMYKRRANRAKGVARKRSKALEAATKASSTASSVDEDDATSTITASTSTAVDPHPLAPAAGDDTETEGKPPLTGATKDAWTNFMADNRELDEKQDTMERFLSGPGTEVPQSKTGGESDSKQTAPEDTPSGKAEEEKKHDKAKADGPDSKLNSTKGAPKTSHIMPSWIRQIFSNESQVDWEKEDLEAVLLELTVSFDSKSKKKLTKLQMDDEAVKSAVSKLTSRSRFKRRPRLLEQYRSLDPRVRHEVDEAITTVKQWDSREKLWVAIEVIEDVAQSGRSQSLDVSVMLFFRVGQEVEPVRLDVGRELLLPFEHCRTWESTKSILSKLLWEESARQRVLSTRYDICLPDGASIPQETWESTVRPGMKLKLKLWPPSFPPFGRPMGMGPPPARGMRVPPHVITVGPPNFPKPTVSVAAPKKSKAEVRVEIMKEMDELLGIETGLEKETDKPKAGLGELLGLWTNAPDTQMEEPTEAWSSDFSSDSSSSSASSSSGSDSDYVDN
ncbi:hypothetical protein ACJ41O_001348 [Fusarium nematophilum]